MSGAVYRFSIRKRSQFNKHGEVTVYDVICNSGKGHKNALQLAAKLNTLKLPRIKPKTGEQVNRP